ncbi:MAG TPA: hypothetical protein VNZ64_08205 [Candidatus Acidoferrum sp.]|jgi:hypothetical protein|nr:hypothetical protein [Candidatus Acidoferrum sp.]
MRLPYGCSQAGNRTSWVFLGACLLGLGGNAAVINISPGNPYAYTNIESARAGDQVLIAPGTYAFRVYLTQQATPTNPIIIRAQDPSNPPVWDFGTTLVENAKGSYTAPDRGRGGWQFSGAKNYSLSGLVFKNCRTAGFNSAGIRYYSGTTNLYVKDCVFTQNDNGMTGGTQESAATVEYCEFVANGNTNASSGSPTHNLYIYGGYFTLRYCYVHDPVQAQNFHIRARNSTLEYNWIARAQSYEGDLMTDDDLTGPGPFSQAMTLRGNLFLQSAAPNNHSQEVAIFNDNSAISNLTLAVRAVFNTFVGNGGSTAFFHVSNADKTRMVLEECDNIISGTTLPYLVENVAFATVSGVNNWLPSNASTAGLSGSVQSAAPGFRNPAAKDYTLAPGSACIGAANASVYGLPGREYFRNELTNRFWRVRAAARDIGAFESSTTSSPVGPYEPAPLPVLGLVPFSGAAAASWPLFASDFQLWQSDLAQPVTWSQVGFPTSTSAIGVSVAIPLSSAKEFFRLQKPLTAGQ